MAKFNDGIHLSVPAQLVPAEFSQLRKAAFSAGIRAELVLAKSGKSQHARVQFRIQGGKHKWWLVALWHPHNGRLFLKYSRKKPKIADFESSDWAQVLAFVRDHV